MSCSSIIHIQVIHMDNKLLTMKIWNDVYFLTRSPGPNYLLLTSNTPIYWSTLQKKNIFMSFFNVKRIQVLIVSFNQYSAWYSQNQLITSNFQSPFLHITRAQQIVYDNIWEVRAGATFCSEYWIWIHNTMTLWKVSSKYGLHNHLTIKDNYFDFFELSYFIIWL